MLEKIACGAFIVFFALVTIGLYFACYGGAI